MAVNIPPELYPRLLIAPQYDVPKKVVFCDLNPVQTFYRNEPSVLLRETNEVAKLKAHIRLLEAELKQRDAVRTEPTVIRQPPVPKPVPPPAPQRRVVPKPKSKIAPVVYRIIGTLCALAVIPSIVACVMIPPVGVMALITAVCMSLHCFSEASEYK